MRDQVASLSMRVLLPALTTRPARYWTTEQPARRRFTRGVSQGTGGGCVIAGQSTQGVYLTDSTARKFHLEPYELG